MRSLVSLSVLWLWGVSIWQGVIPNIFIGLLGMLLLYASGEDEHDFYNDVQE